MSEARRGDTESMALTTTSTSVDELASLVLQIKSIPTTSSETNDILKKLQTLHKKIAAEIVSQKKVNEEELSILKKKEAEQQLHVYQLTTASRSKHDGTLRAHDAAQIELRRGEKILEKCQENIKLTQIQQSQRIGILSKNEADCLLWIAQLHSDNITKANVYFKCCIGRYRGLYNISTDNERDAWLEQLPRDSTKIVSACQLSPAVLSALNGVVGEAGALVARATTTLHHLLTSKNNDSVDKDVAFSDFATGLNIYQRLGNVPEAINVLKRVIQFRRSLKDFRFAAVGEHVLIKMMQSMQDFGGMIRAGINESLMCLLQAQTPITKQQQLQVSPIARVFLKPGQNPYSINAQTRSTLSGGTSSSSKGTSNDNEGRVQFARRYLRLAVGAAKTAVDMCAMVEAQGLSNVLNTKSEDLEDGGLKCAAHHQLSQVYHFAWEMSSQMGLADSSDDVVLSTDLLPLDQPEQLANMLKEQLQLALKSAKNLSLSRDGVFAAVTKCIRDLHLELGGLMFTTLIADRSGWKENSGGGGKDTAILNDAKKHLDCAAVVHDQLKSELEHSDPGSCIVSLDEDQFISKLNVNFGSVETMLGNLKVAGGCYEKAAIIFDRNGNQKQSEHCRAMCKRLNHSMTSSSLSKTKFNGMETVATPAPSCSENQFIQDTEGIDSDDELGEMGFVE